MKSTYKQLALALMLATASFAAVPPAQTQEERLGRQIRKELLTMPFLTIFDNLAYRIDGDTVYLSGQTIRPTIQSSAAKRVEHLEGVRHVVNQIEVLPLSPFDDRIRLAVARAVYGQPALNRYALGANPSIRIIVKNGNVTLEGAVANTMDRNIANIRANGVSGVFSVTNNLQVDRS